MIDLAGQHRHLARAAQPFLAIARNIDAARTQGLQQASCRPARGPTARYPSARRRRRSPSRGPAARRAGEKCSTCRRSGRSRGSFSERGQQALGPAGVDLGVLRRWRAISAARSSGSPPTLGIEVQAVAVVAPQPLDESHAGARSAGVVDRILLAEPLEAVGHRDDRRDADAAGDQQVVLGASSSRRKWFLRAADADHGAGRRWSRGCRPSRRAPRPPLGPRSAGGRVARLAAERVFAASSRRRSRRYARPASSAAEARPCGSSSVSRTTPSASRSTAATRTGRASACFGGAPMANGVCRSSTPGPRRSGFRLGSHRTQRWSGPRNDVFGR